ncbi:NUDIX domain-containing protein [Nannocystaceae bacterium ST9]
MPLSPDEQRDLVVLLRRLADEGGAMPTTPRAIWDALAGVVPRLAVELGLFAGEAILLSHRDDETWRGWHIPGGFVGRDETLADACRRIARRELGVEVELIGVVGSFAWPDHPCGSVLSLLCACRSDATPRDARFFVELPEPMVRHHAGMVDELRRHRITSP